MVKQSLIGLAALGAAAVAPAHAAGDFSIGAGFAGFDVGTASGTGYVIEGMVKVDPKLAVAIDLHEGGIFGVSARYYMDKMYDGVFLEGGMLSGGGASVADIGAGFEIGAAKNVSIRAGFGAIIGSGGTALGYRVTANYIP